MKMNKYKARKTEVGGIKFDSKKEAVRFMELQALQRGGYIRNLKRQVPFILIEGYRTSSGKAERPCKYIAEFTYHRILADGSFDYVVEDVKGCRKGAAYQIFTIKKKIMWDKFRIEIKEY